MKGPKNPVPVYVPRGYDPSLDPKIEFTPGPTDPRILVPNSTQLLIGPLRGNDTHVSIPLPSMKRGGTVAKSGGYYLHKGERVVPARAKKATTTAAKKKR